MLFFLFFFGLLVSHLVVLVICMNAIWLQRNLEAFGHTGINSHILVFDKAMFKPKRNFFYFINGL